jgi:hypothetical protein
LKPKRNVNIILQLTSYYTENTKSLLHNKVGYCRVRNLSVFTVAMKRNTRANMQHVDNAEHLKLKFTVYTAV